MDIRSLQIPVSGVHTGYQSLVPVSWHEIYNIITCSPRERGPPEGDSSGSFIKTPVYKKIFLLPDELGSIDLGLQIYGVNMMYGKNTFRVPVLVVITIVLIMILCPATVAESSVQINSRVCVNGHCTSTGYPGYYPYPDHYPDYPGYLVYPGYLDGYPYGIDNRYYCSPYRTARYHGYLSAGQYRVYGFRIGGERSYIEWILDGGCGYQEPPVMMGMGTDQVYSWRQTSCGADFDIYVYQNRYPCSSCRADRWDTSRSSNAYVGWDSPCQGCYYSVVVYCRSGSGSYDLTSNSYVNNCWYPYDSSGPVMMSTVEHAMSAGSDNILMMEGSQQFDASDVIWNEDNPSGGDVSVFPGSSGDNWQPPE